MLMEGSSLGRLADDEKFATEDDLENAFVDRFEATGLWGYMGLHALMLYSFRMLMPLCCTHVLHNLPLIQRQLWD
jgi:hypothetical protein